MERWRAAIVMYSAAVSVKMNVLLMAPSVLIVLLKVCAALHCLKRLSLKQITTWVTQD